MNKLLTASIVLATVSISHAESLEERKYWKGQMDYLSDHIESASKACDVKFTFEWVDKPKLREETAKTKHSPNGVCNEIISTVGSLCREGADEKSSVKAKIKGFQCGHTKPRKLDLSKAGILKYMGNNEEPNVRDWARPWLMKQL